MSVSAYSRIPKDSHCLMAFYAFSVLELINIAVIAFGSNLFVVFTVESCLFNQSITIKQMYLSLFFVLKQSHLRLFY